MKSRWGKILTLGVLCLSALQLSADPGRRDILRKTVNFFELEVPSKGGPPQKFALTIFETFDYEYHLAGDRRGLFTLRDEQNRGAVRRQLMLQVQNWYAKHLSDSTGTALTPEFVESLQKEHSLFYGRNTIVVLSDPNDFSKILALLRVAKPSLSVPELPVQRQFKDKLIPLPEAPFVRVPDNRIQIYSYRHPEPHQIEIQNARVFEGDTLELKHYSAVRRRDVDLSAILFHAAQEEGALSVSRFEEGQSLGLGSGPVLVRPAQFVAESDNPAVIEQLLSFGLEEHQNFPGAIHADRVTRILVGDADQLARGFYDWNAKRRNSWQLSDIKLTRREDESFIKQLLPGQCTPDFLASLARLNQAAQIKLEEAVQRATGGRR